ncbi:Conserved hypothetical membrane protein [Pseudomonas veronii 1YdBTEX2]|uniref:Conserved hypothetical membrane protein n=1 Tax=Pseudomonas veronii 1YdBTEX2 TaxID=1295141 RepID=A0A1D3K7W1_PSEVE|nr:hypothetical protein [Pseudomonas veronii]SBW84362.1 Conserved hypothetical membrane protein [Pseudomonas veronii 1YdBTEX2]
MVPLTCMLAAAGFGSVAERVLPSAEGDVPPLSLGKVLDYFPYCLGGVLASCLSQVSPKAAVIFVIIHSLVMVLTSGDFRFTSTSPVTRAQLAGFSPALLVCGGRILMLKLTFFLMIVFTLALPIIQLAL